MKKTLALLLTICLMFTAIPFAANAQDANLTITTSVERDFYYTGDTVNVTLDISGNSSGFSSFRGKLHCDTENLTLQSIECNAVEDTNNGSEISFSYSVHDGYIQLLWTAEPGIVNYNLDGVIAQLCFTVNEKADNKTYNFDFEFMDGTRFVYSENFKDTVWEYIEAPTVVNDFMKVDTLIDSMLYFEDAPTGAYLGESVSLDIAFSAETGLYIFKSKLHYDADLYDFSACTAANDALNLTYNVKDGYVLLLFDNIAPENFNEEGIIATVTFTVKEDAPLGNTTFSLEYVDAVLVDLSNGVSVEKAYFNALSCQFPILETKIPVNATFNRGNGESETITLYKGEKLILPDTNFVDKNWYTDAGAAVEYIYNETTCPGEDFVLYSSACAVDYSGSDFIVPYRYNQLFEVEKDGSAETLKYTSAQSDTANMFRIAKLNDNTTYKLSVTYKAQIDGSLGFGLAGGTGNNMYVNTSYFEGDASTSLYNVTSSADYKTAEIYFTASLKGTVAEQSAGDDSKSVNGNGWTYLFIIDQNVADTDTINIKNIEITEIDDALSVGGASILNEAGLAAANNRQALRYFFSYTTAVAGDGSKILLDGNGYEIVSRGFLYRNGAVDKYLDKYSVTKEGMNRTAAANNAEIILHSKESGFNQCWEYDSDKNILCFSTYVNNYTEDMYSYKLMVRGFITFRDAEGNEFTIYSAPINRSINGIMGNPVSGVDVL